MRIPESIAQPILEGYADLQPWTAQAVHITAGFLGLEGEPSSPNSSITLWLLRCVWIARDSFRYLDSAAQYLRIMLMDISGASCFHDLPFSLRFRALWVTLYSLTWVTIFEIGNMDRWRSRCCLQYCGKLGFANTYRGTFSSFGGQCLPLSSLVCLSRARLAFGTSVQHSYFESKLCCIYSETEQMGAYLHLVLVLLGSIGWALESLVAAACCCGYQ